MKRRSFIQKLTAGTSLSVIPVLPFNANGQVFFNPYMKSPSTIAEALSEEGFIMVRLAFEGNGTEKITGIDGNIEIKKGKLHRSKNYFFEPGFDELEYVSAEYQLSVYKNDTDIIVLWIEDATPETSITINQKEIKLSILISDLLAQPEIKIEEDDFTVTANLLFDKEIGKINFADVGITENGDSFSFVIMADPQGGSPEAPNQDSPTRVKIHNAFIEETIERVNELEKKPAFSVVIGDFVDSKGQMENFIQMKRFYEKLNHPVLLEVGNHETAYNARFSPGYYMGDLDNFFTIQKAMNGMNKILYSFDLGKWHFIVWPDPLRSEFWPTHPHYFDWLERDLEAHKTKPVIFMQHIPIHPIGINPLINYAESVEIKKLLLDILSKHGNVKYVFSGHVHIPLKASVKTAVMMNGIKFINLPAAGYRPRAFGEEDFYGGPAQGFAYIDIDGDNVAVYYKNVTREIYRYPDNFPEFNQKTYPLWLNHKWELPAFDFIQNGNFENRLDYWHKRYIYTEDKNPSNFAEVRKGEGINGSNALYLYSRKRGYDIPGQDRMPQTINRICQVLETGKGQYPVIELVYKVDPAHYNPGFRSGAFIWIEGFKNSLKRLNLCYSLSKMYGNIGGRFSQIGNIYPAHFDLPVITKDWAKAILNIAADHNRNEDHMPYNELGLNKIAINLGTWSINDGYLHEFGIYINEIVMNTTITDLNKPSNVNGSTLNNKMDKDIYYFRNDHVAGEHQFASQKQLYPTSKK
jgi:hypothetical protein